MAEMPAHDVVPESQSDPIRKADFKRLVGYLVIVGVLVIGASITASRLTPGVEGIAMSLLNVTAVWAYAAGAGTLCFWAHYKACQVTYRYFLVDGAGQIPNRVLYAMLCMTVAHLGEMTMWGLALWVAAIPMGVGELSGDTTGTFVDYLHFAFAAYTSLGLGDVKPEAYLKLITGMTTLTGLLCIGWTCSLFVGKMGSLMEQTDERREQDG